MHGITVTKINRIVSIKLNYENSDVRSRYSLDELAEKSHSFRSTLKLEVPQLLTVSSTNQRTFDVDFQINGQRCNKVNNRAVGLEDAGVDGGVLIVSFWFLSVECTDGFDLRAERHSQQSIKRAVRPIIADTTKTLTNRPLIFSAQSSFTSSEFFE